MSGTSFGSTGTAGVVPQTVWMSALADKLTIVMPWTEMGNPTFPTLPIPLHSCNLANQYPTYNSSFGAFTTAPDGTTNTAQKIVEDNTNNLHYISAVLTLQYEGNYPVFRMAGIFKAAERTRICFSNYGSDFGNKQFFVGFDLAGVQIAYGPTSTIGGNPGTASIQALGGGWCLCIFDVNLFLAESLFFRVHLDNGSGTAAQSITYTGNGTSGVYGWKQSVLPKRAWGIQNVVMFDDFNDTSTIDLNNTLAPGYHWYVSNAWPYWLDVGNYNYTYLPGSLTVSSSVLRIAAQSPPSVPSNSDVGGYGWPTLTTAAPLGVSSTFPLPSPRGTGTYVGRGFRPPCFLECKMKFNVSNFAPDGADLIFWGAGLEFAAQLSNPGPQNFSVNGSEYDIWEELQVNPQAQTWFYIPGRTSPFGSGGLRGIQIQNTANFIPYIGCFEWAPGFYLAGTNSVHFSDGNFYYATSQTSNVPPAAPWALYDPGHTHILVDQPNVVVDVQNTFHTSAILVLPYDPITGDRGCRIQFFDGMCNGGHSWAPLVSGPDGSDPYFWKSDWNQIFLMLNAGVVTGSGYDMFIDFVRVTQ